MTLKWEPADAETIKAHERSMADADREFAEMEAHYRMNLECAEIALTQFKRLTAEDREAIEDAVENLKTGWAAIQTMPPAARRAAYRLMAGAHVIGSRATVCGSEKIYWDIKSHGPGARKLLEFRHRDAADWQDRARRLMRPFFDENPEITAEAMAQNTYNKKRIPVSYEWYVRTCVRPTLKQWRAGERKVALRLIK